MSIYGEQWVCLCGWSNVFLRKHCRNCDGPRELCTTHEQGAGEAIAALETSLSETELKEGK